MSVYLLFSLGAAFAASLLFWACCIVGKRADDAFDDISFRVQSLEKVARDMKKRIAQRNLGKPRDPYSDMLEDVPPTGSGWTWR